MQHEFIKIFVFHRTNRISQRGNVCEQLADRQVVAVKNMEYRIFLSTARQAADRPGDRVDRREIDPAACQRLRAAACPHNGLQQLGKAVSGLVHLEFSVCDASLQVADAHDLGAQAAGNLEQDQFFSSEFAFQIIVGQILADPQALFTQGYADLRHLALDKAADAQRRDVNQCGVMLFAECNHIANTVHIGLPDPVADAEMADIRCAVDDGINFDAIRQADDFVPDQIAVDSEQALSERFGEIIFKVVEE